MKKIVFLVLLMASSFSQAGGYYQHISQGYDIESGMFYYPIKHKKDAGGMFSSKSNTRIKNIFIFDPNSGKKSYLFERGSTYSIEYFTFEMTFLESKSIKFFGSQSRTKNNSKIEKRLLNDRMIIVTSKKDSDQRIMWVANKNGSDLKELHSYNKSVSWHIDVKNERIRFITGADEISINSIKW